MQTRNTFTRLLVAFAGFLFIFTISFGSANPIQKKSKAPSKATQEIGIMDTGFAITIPTAWVQKKTRTDLTLTIPASTGTDGGKIKLFGVDFRGTIDSWQKDQVLVETSFRHTITQQSQEQVLGVPLLLTQSTYLDGTKNKTIETGILMVASNRKLFFRIESDTASSQALFADWNDRLTSLRTINGSTPVVDDPSQPLTAAEKAKPDTLIPTVLKLGQGKKVFAIIGSVVIPGSAANRSVEIHLPKGWQFVKQASGWTISNPALGYPLLMVLASNLDSADAQPALLTQSANSLAKFTTVTSREEKAGAINIAGDITDIIFRKGRNQIGEVESVDGSVAMNEFYILISGTFPRQLKKNEEDIIRTLFNEAAIVGKSS